MIYQGTCPDDHSGLSVDAGGDWNGDGIPDVILGGGAKVDLEGQSIRVDEYANPASIYLGGLGVENFTVPCPEEGVQDLDQPLQFPDLRLVGTQVSPFPNTEPDGTTSHPSNSWMLADRFGWCVRFVGDVNGPEPEPDGPGSVVHDDIAVSAPWYDVEQPGSSTLFQAGAVYVYLGRDFDRGTVPVGATAPIGSYEKHLADKFTDDPTNPGYCDLIIEGAGAGDYFGYAISRELDFDADGYPDLAIGAPQYAWQNDYAPSALTTDDQWPNPDARPGKAYVVKGSYLRCLFNSSACGTSRTVGIASLVADGYAYELISPNSVAGDRFGASLDGIREQDDDPVFVGDELVIGAPQFRSDWNDGAPQSSSKKTSNTADDDSDGGNGYVTIWSTDPAIVADPDAIPPVLAAAIQRHVVPGPAEAGGAGTFDLKPRFGWSVSRVAWSQQSSVTGFVVGAPGFNFPPDEPGDPIQENVGLVEMYAFDTDASASPTLKWTSTGFQPKAEMGYSLASGGDFNADAVPDIAVGTRKFTRSGETPICSCSADRPNTAGLIQVLSSVQLTASPRSRLLANFFGETARDRLGFSCAFLGSTPGYPGDAVIGGALAWPDEAAPPALIGGGSAPLCTDCPTPLACPPSNFVEEGRGYLLRAEPVQ